MRAAAEEPIEVERIVVTVYRAPVAVPVVAAMGTLTDRPAVIVEVTDRDGAHGFGEVWCNFPTCGAEHRARLIQSFFAPLVLRRRFARPRDAFEELTGQAVRLVLQSGEPGPFAQAIAGLDVALTDLAARRAGLPVWQYLRAQAAEPAQAAEGDSGPAQAAAGGSGRPAQAAEPAQAAAGDSGRPAQAAEPAQAAAGGSGPAQAAEGDSGPKNPPRGHGAGEVALDAYASGINPDGAVQQALAAFDAGYRAFKLKIGFGAERDLANLQALRDVLGPEVAIAVDANQAWDLPEALRMSEALADHDPLWLEEPLPADHPDEAWQALAQASPVPLAGGENLRGRAAFGHAIRQGALRVLQPDLAKWGGFTGCLEVARAARAAGRTYCPHYLGGGIGLVASAHLLAAAGGDGLLEVDSNDNPLREGLAVPFPALDHGRFVLGDGPGLGVAPAPEVARFETLRLGN